MFNFWYRKHKPSEGPLSVWALLELSLYSTFIFIFSALLMQLILCAWMMLLLLHFGINFRYSLFHIFFLSESGTKWSENMIFLVFGSGPVLLSAVGLILLLVLKKLSMAAWRTKLLFSWLSFLMVNALPCNILAGTLFYNGFGVAYFWMVNSLIFRIIFSFIILAILVGISFYWYRFFLKTAYTKAFLNDKDNQRTFFSAVFLRPWIAGLIVLIGFNWPFTDWYWPLTIFCLGFMGIAIMGNSRIQSKPMIKKSDKKIFNDQWQIALFAMALILEWFAGNVRFNF